MVVVSFDYSEEKDLVLIETRGIGFEDVIKSISEGKLLDNINHPNQKRYRGQRLFIVKIDKYVYVVPYKYDAKRKLFFLKTLYPSRNMTKKYLKGGEK